MDPKTKSPDDLSLAESIPSSNKDSETLLSNLLSVAENTTSLKEDSDSEYEPHDHSFWGKPGKHPKGTIVYLVSETGKLWPFEYNKLAKVGYAGIRLGEFNSWKEKLEDVLVMEGVGDAPLETYQQWLTKGCSGDIEM